MAQLGKVRRNLTTILTYDWISVPLVYTQVGGRKAIFLPSRPFVI
jgi:hypothetical protein